jgi:hypothetical protein
MKNKDEGSLSMVDEGDGEGWEEHENRWGATLHASNFVRSVPVAQWDGHVRKMPRGAAVRISG